MKAVKTIKPVPGNIPWVRADLSAWGEVIDTVFGVYRKTWEPSDRADPEGDGMIYTLHHEGYEIWAGEKDIEVDVAVFAHGRSIRKTMPHRLAIAANIRKVMPMLEKNFGMVHKEYMDGDAPAGMMRYCRDRLSNAWEIASLTEGDPLYLSPRYLPLAASLTMDVGNAIHRGLGDLAGSPVLSDPAMKEWLDSFDAAGFTERHPVFDFPVAPPPDKSRIISDVLQQKKEEYDARHH